jgi:hypothetical protein
MPPPPDVEASSELGTLLAFGLGDALNAALGGGKAGGSDAGSGGSRKGSDAGEEEKEAGADADAAAADGEAAAAAGALPEGWTSMSDEEGNVWYAHEDGRAMWERPGAEGDALPDGWSTAIDEASGYTYYLSTGGSAQWERPTAAYTGEAGEAEAPPSMPAWRVKLLEAQAKEAASAAARRSLRFF